MIRSAAAIVSVLALTVPTSGSAAASEAARLSYSVVATMYGGQERPRNAGVCIADTNGAEGDRVTGLRKDLRSTWSPDGRSVAFSRERSSIYVQDEHGLSKKIIEAPSYGWGRGYVSPGGWSPDGQRIVYGYGGISGYLQSYSGIATSRPDGTDGRTLTSAIPNGQVSDPAWSPTGNAIAYSNSSYPGPYGLYLIDPDGRNRRFLATGGGQPSWSPDGASIVFTRQNEEHQNRSDLWIIGANGRGERLLTGQPGAEENPAWSPDGDWIAFERLPPGLCGSRCSNGLAVEETDIAVIRPDGSDLHVVRGSTLAEFDPAWRPSAPARPGRKRPCVIRGTHQADTIRGSSGGDLILAGFGRDVILGGGGDDLIDGGPGIDQILGGPGDDFLYSYDGRQDIVIGNSGLDEAIADYQDRVSSVERLNP